MSLTRASAIAAVALSLGVTLTVATAVGSPDATALEAATPGELVLPAQARAVPRATQILTAGATGFLWAQEGDDRLLWTDYATGAATALDRRLPAKVRYDVDSGYFRESAAHEIGWYGRGSDTVALYEGGDSPRVTLLDRTREVGEVAVPAGHAYQGTFGGVVVTRTGGEGEPQAMHLWRDGAATRVTGLPADATGIAVEDGDARSLVLKYESPPNESHLSHYDIVDLARGVATRLPDRMDDDDEGWEVKGFRLGADSVLRSRWGRYALDVLDRDDLGGDYRTLETGQFDHQTEYGIAGTTVLAADRVAPGNNLYRGQPLWTVPAADGDNSDMVKVMDPAGSQLVQAPDGSVLVAGAEKFVQYGDLDWGIHRISQGAGGKVERRRVTAVAPVPATVHGLALGSGILSAATSSTIYEPGGLIGAYHSTWLTTPAAGGTPAVTRTSRDGYVTGDAGRCSDDTVGGRRCIAMFADGAGHHGPQPATGSGETMLYANGDPDWGPTIDTGEHTPDLADVSGRFAVIVGSNGYQHIGEFKPGAAGTVLEKREPVGAAVWGSTLWSAARSGGVVTATRLPGRTAVETFTTRNGCTPSDLQAVGRWVHWTCEDEWGDLKGAGIYDRTAKRTVTAPAGQVLLGDGYLIERVEGTGLRLYDLHAGLPASGNHADLPKRTLVGEAELGTTDRIAVRKSWTVDRFGGAVAYTDDEQRIHIVPTGVPAAALTAIDATVGTSAANFTGTWWLSKPAASWQLAFRNQAGTVLRTVSGSAAQGLIKAAWDGKDSAGNPVADGAFTWTLTAQPADGQGAALTVPGPALAAPVMKPTVRPTVTGTFVVGATVKAGPGSWTPAATSYTYRWTANGVTINGATGSSYAIPATMLGKRLAVVVTGNRAGHTSTAIASNPSVAIAKGAAAQATARPAVTGTVKAGYTVKATAGAWTPKPMAYGYEWRLNNVIVRGVTGPSLKLTTAMRGKQLTVTVFARRTGHHDGRSISKAVTVR